MEAFTELDAVASPVMRQNIDTDIVIPIHRLRDVAQAELGPYAFEPLRYLPDGSDNPEFPLNKPAFKGAEILVADNNFACGSSREGAVWALAGMGVKAVIAPSYGDIFYSNCFKNGVLPIKVSKQTLQKLFETKSEIEVDLENQLIKFDATKIPFEIEAHWKKILLEGLDDIAVTLTREDKISKYERSQANTKFPAS